MAKYEDTIPDDLRVRIQSYVDVNFLHCLFTFRVKTRRSWFSHCGQKMILVDFYDRSPCCEHLKFYTWRRFCVCNTCTHIEKSEWAYK